MKNSAWYQKLWRKKLDELPLQKDTESAWPNMKKLLDEHIPETGTEGGNSDSPFRISLVSLLGYLILIAVIIGAIGYFYAYQSITSKNVQNQKPKQQVHIDTLKHGEISFDSKNKNIIDIKHLKLKPNTFVKNSNAAVYPDKQSSTVSKTETATLNPGTKIKALTDSNSLSRVVLPERTTSVSSKFSIPSAGIEKRSRLQTHSVVKTVTKENRKPDFYKGKPTGSVGKIKLKDRYLNGNNADEYTKAITRKSIIQDSASNIAKLKQVPAIAAITEKNRNQPEASSKSNVNPSKNIAKGKKANVFLTPPYNYGLEIGLNTSNNVRFYFGGFGSYTLNNRWLFNAGIRINSYKQLSGEYSHPSYYRPDSLPPFKIIDSRKLLVMDIPINLEYKISKTISVKTGPVISLLLKQTDISSKLGTIADLRDTVYHSKEINKAINNTIINKVSFGFTGGLTFHLNKFDLNSNYQLLTPYKVSNDLGHYRKTNNTFQVSIGYRFK